MASLFALVLSFLFLARFEFQSNLYRLECLFVLFFIRFYEKYSFCLFIFVESNTLPTIRSSRSKPMSPSSPMCISSVFL